MTVSGTQLLDQAMQRLSAALDRLELAATARLDAERGLEPLETELSVMRDDRSRLAVELDGALARNADLEHMTRELSVRVGRAIDAVETVLAATAPEPDGRGETP